MDAWSLQTQCAELTQPGTSVHQWPCLLWSDTPTQFPLQGQMAAQSLALWSAVHHCSPNLGTSQPNNLYAAMSMLTARPTGTAPGLGTAAHRWPASSGSSSPSCQKTNCPTACTFMNSPPGLGCRKEVKENPWPTQLCDRNGLFLFKSFNGLRTQYYTWLYGFHKLIMEPREISKCHVSSKV